MWPVQSQEWKVKFFVPQATNSIWRRETRTMATPMRSLSVGVAKSVREWFASMQGSRTLCSGAICGYIRASSFTTFCTGVVRQHAIKSQAQQLWFLDRRGRGFDDWVHRRRSTSCLNVLSARTFREMNRLRAQTLYMFERSAKRQCSISCDSSV